MGNSSSQERSPTSFDLVEVESGKVDEKKNRLDILTRLYKEENKRKKDDNRDELDHHGVVSLLFSNSHAL